MSGENSGSPKNGGEPTTSRGVEHSSDTREKSASLDSDSAARVFYKRLEELGQLVDVDADTDLASLPPHVTHVRHPNGVVERIGFC
jgi:hypothetical protein